jgi:CSLREA domain-containing protein
MMILLASQAQAASLMVTTEVDELNADGDCSLREAIEAANTNAAVDACVSGSSTETDTIDFAASLSGQPITLASQLPIITAAGGALTIDGGSADITISGNKAVRVFQVGTGTLSGPQLTLKNLTVADGTLASGSGGAIINIGTVMVLNSTFSGNSASLGGGAIDNIGTLEVTNSTFSGNSSATNGGGISNGDGDTATLSNTIMANSPSGGNCAGTITDGGGNLEWPDASCGFATPSADPNLGPLQDNGGPTQTHALLAGSAAIDAAVSCPPPTTDQRGVSRPQGSACDIGAYEVEVLVDTTPPTVTTTIPEDGALEVSRTTTVKANFSEPVKNVSTETFILERKISVKKAPPKFELVDATVTPSDDGLSAELTPVQDLPKGEYRATITTEVTDVADPANALEDPVVWTFTVAN